MPKKRLLGLTPLRLALLFLCLFPSPSLAGTSIGIKAPAPLLAHPAVQLAVQDGIALLRRGFPGARVTLNPGQADVILALEQPRDPFPAPRRRTYRTLAVPDATFRWEAEARGGRRLLRLTAASPEGIASGLYALLQEKLGFRFLHPRQTVYPAHRDWPLPARFSFSGHPRFASRGFHHHTLHPIELTEQLHDPDYPNGFSDIASYLDWLARNGQNTFQFFLLRGVDRARWPAHARSIVNYARRRGLSCGVEVSLCMLQQNAFQTVAPLKPFPSWKSQVDSSLAWLFQADWDFVTLDPTMGEYLPALGRLMPGVQAHFERQVAERYGARVLVATHVIRNDRSERARPLLDSSGILIHSVMDYSVTDPKAPVYGNRNLRFLGEAARTENRRRETWFWPESAYWVCYDNSVPLLLLTYLDSRFEDLEQMAATGVSGHLTFSSGWEWGGWLTDWSIARWSWDYAEKGVSLATHPLSRLDDLFPDPELRRSFREALRLQNLFLKERELQCYLSALTPFAELPPPLAFPFQPTPEASPALLAFGADSKLAAAVLNGPVPELKRYAALMEGICNRLELRIDLLERQGRPARLPLSLARELAGGLRVGALRARHRALTLSALIAGRERPAFTAGAGPGSAPFLARAQEVRQAARQLVAARERGYRFPVGSIARRRTSFSAYRFGYLYPASELFFWRREEEQVRQGRFDPFFMRLWDAWGVLGVKSLFWGE